MNDEHYDSAETFIIEAAESSIGRGCCCFFVDVCLQFFSVCHRTIGSRRLKDTRCLEYVVCVYSVVLLPTLFSFANAVCGDFCLCQCCLSANRFLFAFFPRQVARLLVQLRVLSLKRLGEFALPFFSWSVTDEALTFLSRLVQLRLLILEDSDVTDAGLRHLHALLQLRVVILDGTRVPYSDVRLCTLGQFRVLMEPVGVEIDRFLYLQKPSIDVINRITAWFRSFVGALNIRIRECGVGGHQVH